jgi:hypothetical protein
MLYFVVVSCPSIGTAVTIKARMESWSSRAGFATRTIKECRENADCATSTTAVEHPFRRCFWQFRHSRLSFTTTGVAVYATLIHILENDNRASTLMAFAMIWVVTATFALASAYLVFRVAETRKRLLARVPSSSTNAVVRTRKHS